MMKNINGLGPTSQLCIQENITNGCQREKHLPSHSVHNQEDEKKEHVEGTAKTCKRKKLKVLKSRKARFHVNAIQGLHICHETRAL